jgi:hypothetical protein
MNNGKEELILTQRKYTFAWITKYLSFASK